MSENGSQSEEEKKNKKDPWGDNARGEKPPDLDEVLEKIQKGLWGMFGGKSGTPKTGDKPPPQNIHIPIIALIIPILMWLTYDMTYFIDQQERGIVLRFGKYVQTLGPGLNFRFPQPIEEVYKVNVGQVRSITHKASMLTQDENIVDVEVAVQWQINSPEDYLFNVKDQLGTLRQISESAVREVIGKSELNFVMTSGRSEIAEKQQLLIQKTLDEYVAGIIINSVEMSTVKPPDQVKPAFDDAIKAREDEQRLVNEAEAYRNDVIPKARGGAARIIEEANGYRARIIARAEGEASRFSQLLKEYQKAPEVTRERLYIDAMENVLKGTSKVLVNTDGENSLMYIPIDKLLERKNMRLNDTMQKIESKLLDPNQFTNSRQNTRSDTRDRRIR